MCFLAKNDAAVGVDAPAPPLNHNRKDSSVMGSRSITPESLIDQDKPTQKTSEIIGKTFGKIKIVGFAGFHLQPKKGRAPLRVPFVWSQCECGKLVISNASQVWHETIFSCGCGRGSVNGRPSSWKHGATSGRVKSPEYHSWMSAKKRCFNKKNKAFKNYGGRGITICDGFMDFSFFLSKLGSKPEGKSTLNRIKNDLHYSCGECEQCSRMGWEMNCRWDDYFEQANNRRSNIVVSIGGEKTTLTLACRKLGINFGCVRQFMKRHECSPEEAISSYSK